MENKESKLNISAGTYSNLLTAVLGVNSWDQDPNIPDNQLGIKIRSITTELNSEGILKAVSQDPVLTLLHAFALNHLKHVSFSFINEIGSEDYPHKRVLDAPYPKRPSVISLEKAQEFFEILEAGDQNNDFVPSKNPAQYEQNDLIDQQKNFIRKICEDPIAYYLDFYTRLVDKGPNAPFPEFLQPVQYLQTSLLSNNTLESLCAKNKYMAKFRQLVLTNIDSLLNNNSDESLPYSGTIITIDRTLELFDVLQRIQLGDSAPKFYHSSRYEYYLHYLIAERDHIIYPTISSISIRDLIKLRSVPIGIIGVTDSGIRVDGFNQTPSEFFYHDIDHARRKYQFLSESATKKGITVSEFAEYSNRFTQNVLIPEITPTADDTVEERDRKKAESMILFEVLHEDALAASPEVISSGIMQPPLHRTPFEKIEGDTVVYFMELEAPNIACVYQKLTGEFFDTPEKRSISLGGRYARSKDGIIEAATKLVKLVTPDNISNNNHEIFEALISINDNLPFDSDSEDKQYINL